jgi:hypothetical protein
MVISFIGHDRYLPSKSHHGDLAHFNQKQSPWVWKDTYIFVEDCDKNVMAAHSLKPELVGQDSMSIKDTRGKSVLPEGWCAAAKKPSGAWIEYWWAKPGEKEGSRKLTYLLSAKGTSYVVAAGIYDDKASIAAEILVGDARSRASSTRASMTCSGTRALLRISTRHGRTAPTRNDGQPQTRGTNNEDGQPVDDPKSRTTASHGSRPRTGDLS